MRSVQLAQAQQNRGVTVARTSADEFEEVMQLRLLLEPYALSRSAPRLTESDFAAAAAALDRSARSTDVLERAALHWEFHRILYAKCGVDKANRINAQQIEEARVRVLEKLQPAG